MIFLLIKMWEKRLPLLNFKLDCKAFYTCEFEFLKNFSTFLTLKDKKN